MNNGLEGMKEGNCRDLTEVPSRCRKIMKIAVVTVEIRTGHSPKESKALPFKLMFWGFVMMQHNERTAHVNKF